MCRNWHNTVYRRMWLQPVSAGWKFQNLNWILKHQLKRRFVNVHNLDWCELIVRFSEIYLTEGERRAKWTLFTSLSFGQKPLPKKYEGAFFGGYSFNQLEWYSYKPGLGKWREWRSFFDSEMGKFDREEGGRWEDGKKLVWFRLDLLVMFRESFVRFMFWFLTSMGGPGWTASWERKRRGLGKMLETGPDMRQAWWSSLCF